jgi:hypothetical protein
MLINELSASGRGVIVFRNYIDAALIAYTHSTTLENLINADELTKVTRAALTQFQTIDFGAKQSPGINFATNTATMPRPPGRC